MKLHGIDCDSRNNTLAKNHLLHNLRKYISEKKIGGGNFAKFNSTEKNVLNKDFTLKGSRSLLFGLEACIYTKKLRRFVFVFPYNLRRRFSYTRFFTFSKNKETKRKKLDVFSVKQKIIFVGRKAWPEPFEIEKLSTIFNQFLPRCL